MAETNAHQRAPARQCFTTTWGDSPVIGTAIHDGHQTRDDLTSLYGLSDRQRLYEEDPYTGRMIAGLTNRIVAHRSRFEVDLNRARSAAIYLEPEQAWGLAVWKDKPTAASLERSLAVHDAYYAMLTDRLDRMRERYGRFVLLDIHSYNHRRAGADEPMTPQSEAPDINIGTISMDRAQWAAIVDLVIDHFSASPIAGRHLDVRENVAFQGRGEQTRFVHERYPDEGCAIAIEFKKIFMDEWTGTAYPQAVDDIAAAMAELEPKLERALDACR